MIPAMLERVRRALWTFRQPLTRQPAQLRVPVSDLFVWRNDAQWKTYFELIDIPGLFEPDIHLSDRYATLCFFDKDGAQILEKRVDVVSGQRQTLELSTFIPESHGSYGTFCVFHSRTPETVADLGSYIAERGYVSYRYQDNRLRGYVHGNLDAVTILPGPALQQLGGSSILGREYRLQHELRGPARYEIGIVNPSSRDQCVSCQFVAASTGRLLGTQEARLAPRASHVFSIDVDQTQPGRIVIDSRLIMGRPLVFRIYGQSMDVFHG